METELSLLTQASILQNNEKLISAFLYATQPIVIFIAVQTKHFQQRRYTVGKDAYVKMLHIIYH